MVAVMLMSGRRRSAVVHLVGVRQAIGRGGPVAEGEHGRRRHEAQRREGRERDRKPEAQAGVSAVSMILSVRSPKEKPKAMKGARQASLPRL